MRKSFIEFEIDDGEGEEDSIRVIQLPSKKGVCYDCEGHGTVLNESMRYHCYTQEEVSDLEDDFQEEYFKRGGIYDVKCPTCKGERVVDVVNEDILTQDQKKDYKEYLKILRDREAYERECAMERRWGGHRFGLEP